MKIEDKVEQRRFITLEGGTIADLLLVASEKVQEAEIQGWKATDVSVYASVELVAAGEVENQTKTLRGFISLEREV